MIVDLCHTIEDGLITYRGLPAPVIRDFMGREASRHHYAPGTEFHIGRIDLVANTGTYLDSPFHRFADGPDVAALPLERLADLPGVLVRAPAAGGRAVTADAFAGFELRGRAVLVHTGWDLHWRTERYFEGHPFLTEEAAARLAQAGAALVGIDSYNIDDTADLRRPAHTLLLGAGIPIVEHLCGLRDLPDAPFRFSAVPAKVRGLGTFPVRAYAVVADPDPPGGGRGKPSPARVSVGRWEDAMTPAPVKPLVTPADLDRIDIRVGTIEAVRDVPGSDKLVELEVGFGDHRRTILAGMKKERADPRAITGRQALFVVNLAPRRMMGRLSEGMLFDLGYADGVPPALAVPERPVPDGTRAG